MNRDVLKNALNPYIYSPLSGRLISERAVPPVSENITDQADEQLTSQDSENLISQ